MKKHLLLLYFYIKLALQSIPRLFATALIFALFIGIIGFSAHKLLYKNQAIGKINIALVAPENDALIQSAYSMLLNTDSIKETCEFQIMNQEIALEKLDKKEVYAVIIIPDHFIENILNGINTPAHIIFPKNSEVESLVFRLFADSGATILSSAQSGIYAVSDLLVSSEMNEHIVEMENELNREYLSHAANRAIYFSTTMVSATNNLSLLEYYLSSGLVLLALLGGISCHRLLKKEPASLRILLKIRGISYSWLLICKLISVSLLYFLIIYIGFLLTGFTFTLYKSLIIFLLVLSIVSMLLFIFQVTSHDSLGIMAIFISSVTMIFISGGFIPSVFLPKQLNVLSDFLPTTFWIREVGALLKNSFN